MFGQNVTTMSERQFIVRALISGCVVTVFAVSVSILMIYLVTDGALEITRADCVLWAGIVPACVAPMCLFAISRQRLKVFRLMQQNYTLANYDDLTGLMNRRCFFRDAGAQIAEKRAEGIDGAVLIIDIDNFKRINDRYGHPVGDEALRHVASQMSDIVSTDGLLSRLGGEEFAILASGTRKQIYAIGDALLKSVSEHPLHVDGIEIPMTISVGICSFSASGDLSKLLSLADEALYRSKHDGKNCLSLAA